MSALCIRRPVMTILLMASFIIAGIFGYRQLPVAAVPRVAPVLAASVLLLAGCGSTVNHAMVIRQSQRRHHRYLR